MEQESEVIVVTGAAAGVGRAVVREFARPGRAIALLARDTAGLYNAAREVEQCGAKALAIPVDIAVAEGVEAAADRIERGLPAYSATIAVLRGEICHSRLHRFDPV